MIDWTEHLYQPRRTTGADLNQWLIAQVRDLDVSPGVDFPPQDYLDEIRLRAAEDLWVHSASDDEHRRWIDLIVTTTRTLIDQYLEQHG